jgi:hypothetical protein
MKALTLHVINLFQGDHLCYWHFDHPIAIHSVSIHILTFLS